MELSEKQAEEGLVDEAQALLSEVRHTFFLLVVPGSLCVCTCVSCGVVRVCVEQHTTPLGVQ